MKFKKIISFFLASAVSISMLALPAFADSSNSSSDFAIENGVLTAYDGSGGNITIPDNVTSIGDDVFNECANITSITIPSSVTSIGDEVFEDCSDLSSITVDADNPDFSSVNGVLFSKDKMELIQYPIGSTQTAYAIPNSVTSIGDLAFWDAADLMSITFPSSVTSFGYGAIDGTGYLQNYSGDFAVINNILVDYIGTDSVVTIPDNVTAIGNGAFAWNSDLTSVTIPNGVTSIEKWAFSSCTSLVSVNISNSVTSIGQWVFDGCTSLQNITVDSGNPNYISDSGILFSKDKTQLIQVPSGSTHTSYTIPDSVTSIGDDAFENLISLKSVTIPNSVTSIGNDSFYDCENLTSVTIPSSVTNIGISAFSGTGLTSVTIPNSITAIQDYTFGWCEDLASVSIPDSVTSIGSSAFYDCESLTSATIPNSVTNIGDSAFAQCVSLTSITISNGVTSIGNMMLNGCTSLTSVSIPASVTSIGDDAFANTNLSNISVDADNPNYASVNGVLFSKDKTLLIQYPIGNTQTAYTIPSGVTSIGYDAFSNCENMTSISIPSGVINIGDDAFSYCENLTSISISSSVTSIGGDVFWCCTGLSNITVDPSNANFASVNGVLFNKDKTNLIQYPIGNSQKTYTVPDGVTSIGEEAFCDSSLSSVTIPASVTSIDDSAFWNCYDTFKIYGYKGTYAQTYASDNDISFSMLCPTFGTVNYSITKPTNGSVTVTIPVSGATVASVSHIFTLNGSHTFNVTDKYGATASKTVSVTNIDKTPPTFGTVKYSATALTNGNVTVTIPVTGGTVSSVSHIFTSNGSYTFTVSDAAGNKATTTVKVSNIDKTKPTVNVSIGNGKSTKGKVTVTVSDTNLKAKSIKLGGKSISWPQSNTFTAKGSYSVTVSDKAGNTSTATFSIVK